MTHIRDTFDPRVHDTPAQGGYDRDLPASDRHAMYAARSAEIPKDRQWLVVLIVGIAIAVIGYLTVPPFWLQVVAWLGW